ncbi:MAG: DUF5666 domain-containing protein [bacterium]
MRTIKHLLVAATLICTSTFASADEVIGGSVTSVSADSITVKDEKGEKTLSLSSDTQIAGTATAISEVVVGASVAVRCNAEGTSAVVIRVMPPPDEVVSGSVVSISENSITLKTDQGNQTFAITPETVKKNYTANTDIKADDKIAIRISADKKNATLVNAKPPQ